MRNASSTMPAVLPNVLFFFVDDLGYGDLGFTGNPSARTPNLDRLAADGRRLHSWYSGYPVCSASRTAILTGRQPPRVGMVGVINSLTSSGLPLGEVTVADEMRSAGCKAASIKPGSFMSSPSPHSLRARSRR